MMTRCSMKTFPRLARSGQVVKLEAGSAQGADAGDRGEKAPGSPIRTSLPMAEPSNDQITIRGGGLPARTARTMYCTARVCAANDAGSIASALKTGAMICWNRSNSLGATTAAESRRRAGQLSRTGPGYLRA